MAINFNDYLKMTGLGESAPITSKRRRKRNVKPGKFNPIAFAESYSYAIQDGRRMRLSGIANQREASRITARGEAGLEDAKQFIKDKSKQAWEFLKKLYEKVIKFFTETLRYLMSNERKLGKAIAKLKAAKKTKKDNLTIPRFTGVKNKGESYLGYGEMTDTEISAIEGQMNGLIDERNAARTDANRANASARWERGKAAAYKNQRDQAREGTRRAVSMYQNAREDARQQLAEKQALSQEFNDFIVQKQEDDRVAEEIVLDIANKLTDTSNQLDAANERANRFEEKWKKAEAHIKQMKQSVKEEKPILKKAAQASTVGGKAIITTILSDIFDRSKKAADLIVAQKSLEEGNDEASAIVTEFKDSVSIAVNAAFDTESVEVDKAGYLALVDAGVNFLQELKNARGMKVMQKAINDLKKEKEALEKSWKKESKSTKGDEVKAMEYQLKRVALQTQIKLSNLFMGAQDKVTGKFISYYGRLGAAA